MTAGPLSFSQHMHQMPWTRSKSKHWKGKKLLRQPLFIYAAHSVFREWVPGPQEVTTTSSTVEHGKCAVGDLRRTRILLPWIRLFWVFFQWWHFRFGCWGLNITPPTKEVLKKYLKHKTREPSPFLELDSLEQHVAFRKQSMVLCNCHREMCELGCHMTLLKIGQMESH